MEEQAAVETGVVDGTVETFEYEPNQFYKDEVIGLPYIEKVTLKDSDDVEIYGSGEQRIEMFTDWASYIGEIQNPNNTSINPFFKKADGTGTLYAPLSEVLNTIRPVLAKYGFGIIQIPISKTGQMSIKTILTHKSGGFMNFPNFTIPVTKNDPQGILSTETYARRGSLNPLMGVQGEVDDDGNSLTGKDKEKPKSETPKATVSEDVVAKQKLVISLAKELIDGGTDREKVNTTLETTCQSKNPNSVKDIKLLDAAFTALDKIRTDKKAGK